MRIFDCPSRTNQLYNINPTLSILFYKFYKLQKKIARTVPAIFVKRVFKRIKG